MQGLIFLSAERTFFKFRITLVELACRALAAYLKAWRSG
jgi:hypothetical protein